MPSKEWLTLLGHLQQTKRKDSASLQFLPRTDKLKSLNLHSCQPELDFTFDTKATYHDHRLNKNAYVNEPIQRGRNQVHSKAVDTRVGFPELRSPKGVWVRATDEELGEEEDDAPDRDKDDERPITDVERSSLSFALEDPAKEEQDR